MTTETIVWHPASTKPDSDITVLCWGSEGFFCGYWDDSGAGWIGCESGGSVLGVTHWAEPDGPSDATDPPVVDVDEMQLVAQELADLATRRGMVLTIEQRPLLPLAMGHYETLASVREVRR